MLIRFNFSLTVVSLIMQIAIFLSITWCYNLWKYIVAPLIINDLILSSQSYLLLSFLFFCFFVFVFFQIIVKHLDTTLHRLRLVIVCTYEPV